MKEEQFFKSYGQRSVDEEAKFYRSHDSVRRWKVRCWWIGALVVSLLAMQWAVVVMIRRLSDEVGLFEERESSFWPAVVFLTCQVMIPIFSTRMVDSFKDET